MCVLDLIRVSDNKRALVGEVVVDVWDDLYGHVCFPRPRGSNYHGQTWLHAWPYGLNLGGGERNLISERKFDQPKFIINQKYSNALNNLIFMRYYNKSFPK